MAYTTINKSSDYFNTITTTGGAKSVTGVGFQPDWVWNKRRDSTSDHHINDAVRGSSKLLYTNATTAEQTNANFLTSFDSDGFTTGSGYWSSSANIVSWNWKANGAGSANTDGSINSTVSANTTAGFSIVTWSGTGSNGTIGHGLGATPSLMIIKNNNNVGEWRVWNSTFNADQYLYLNRTDAVATQSILFNSTLPTSSVISVGTSGDINASGRTYVAYCFAEKKGYSKFGSYTGNGNADGTFVYTGFKPAWIMQKRTDVVNGWLIFDTKRDTFNACDKYLTANASSSEPTSGTDYVDILSNGLKMRRSGNDINGSGASYIYMAFAEAPLVGSNNVPCTAR